MKEIEFDAHNAELKEVWDAYHQEKPTRVPMSLGVGPRYTMEIPEVNPDGVDFEEYSTNPLAMLKRQLEHQYWVRHHIPQDAEMGLPKDGWTVHVDLQNYYEAGWFGCDVEFRRGQVPGSMPILQDDDKKRSLFELGAPDAFLGGIMQRNWEFFDALSSQQEAGYTFKGLPIINILPTGLGTDGPVTVACNLRGTTEFMTDLLADTEYALELLDYITEATITRIKAYREQLGMPLKTQSWGFADDSIQLISTGVYKELVLSYHRRLVETFSEGGPNSIHLCGDSTHHFPFLSEALNIKSFDTGYPIDFAWVREQVGSKVNINGGPSVPFLQTHTPDEVRAEVRRILTSGVMEGGRFVLREGNNLAPGIPLENLWAMYDTVKEYGVYR